MLRPTLVSIVCKWSPPCIQIFLYISLSFYTSDFIYLYISVSLSFGRKHKQFTNSCKCKTLKYSINFWLRKNKLSLKYNKTNFMLINKHPHKTVECDFNLSINDAVLSRTDSVKYLGAYLDDNWIPHIKYLSLQLAQYSGLFYRIRNLVPNHILLML